MEAHESEAQGRRGGSSATTLVLLFLALAAVFLFGGSRGEPVYGTAGGYHAELTRDHMVVALNMSPEHGFLGFLQLTRTGDGDLVYGRLYNRFPVLGYVLIKLVTLPLPDDFSAREAAARTLMLVLFAVAATLAYLALCRLTGNRWAALAATLLAFSSYFALFYADMVATEGVRTLTPDNRFVFLYDRAGHDAALSRYERHAEQAAPVLDGADYDLYLVEGARWNELLFFRDQCPNHQVVDHLHAQHVLMGGGRVFARVWPADANDLPVARRPFGFDALIDFRQRLPG